MLFIYFVLIFCNAPWIGMLEAEGNKVLRTFKEKPASAICVEVYPKENAVLILKECFPLEQLKNIKEIGDDFLREIELCGLDLTGCDNIEEIGNNFLYCCNSLLGISGLNRLPKLHTIGNNFLASCVKLQILHLDWKMLKSIGDYFLARCTGLKTIDFTSFTNVRTIGEGFLSNTLFESLNLSSLKNVKLVRPFFLGSCTCLTELTINFHPDVQLERYLTGTEFLAYCTQLQRVDLTSLRHIQPSVYGDPSFLAFCSEDLKKFVLCQMLHAEFIDC